MPQIDRELLKRARALRFGMTEPETRLWLAIRAKRLNGIKFVRQTVRGRAIPDFVARSHNLVIEVDGDTHAISEAYDARRTAVLERQGYRVLRFTNADVMTNLDGVLQTILGAVTSAPLPILSPQGRGL
ncbi:endonuclease domain-containing protein [Roseomonas aeriglobus]|nr:endonuclease domain-containing protein [Roseomonas aeriglobus]